MKYIIFLLTAIISISVSNAEDKVEYIDSIAVCAATTKIIASEISHAPTNTIIENEGQWWYDLGIELYPINFDLVYESTLRTISFEYKNERIAWADIVNASISCSMRKTEDYTSKQ